MILDPKSMRAPCCGSSKRLLHTLSAGTHKKRKCDRKFKNRYIASNSTSQRGALSQDHQVGCQGGALSAVCVQCDYLGISPH